MTSSVSEALLLCILLKEHFCLFSARPPLLLLSYPILPFSIHPAQLRQDPQFRLALAIGTDMKSFCSQLINRAGLTLGHLRWGGSVSINVSAYSSMQPCCQSCCLNTRDNKHNPYKCSAIRQIRLKKRVQQLTGFKLYTYTYNSYVVTYFNILMNTKTCNKNIDITQRGK